MQPNNAESTNEPLDPGQVSERPPAAVDKAKKFWWAGAVVVPLIAAGVGILPSLLGSKPSQPNINITDSHDLSFHQINVFEQEYRAKVGEDLPAELREQIQQALAHLNEGRFSDGIPILQQAAEKAPVPSLLADLGTALALAGNASDANAAFAKAAAAAPDNEAAARGRQYLANAAKNNDILSPAEIPIGTAISATLLDRDQDFFSFTTPAGPRDYIRVTLKNRSPHFYPQLAAYDAQRAKINGVSTPTGHGGDLTHTFPATPASKHIVSAYPYGDAGGAYTLLVEPVRAFDDYEPNDTIQAPREIPSGQVIEANIMDEWDKDYYKFRARSAVTVITVDNRSEDLQIRLATFDSDRAPVGSHSTGAGPSANLRHEIQTVPGGVYILQAWPYGSGAGKYAISIQ
jgi:hypothetical protein